MNIGLFTDTYYPQINGVTTSVRTLSDELTKRGHNVYIFTPSSPDEPEDEKNVIRMPSMPIFFVQPFRWGVLYSPKTLAKIAHLHLDIIHTQTEFSLGLFGKILSKALHIPIVHTYHTMYEDYVHYIARGVLVKPEMAQDYSRIFCNSTNCVIAPTEKVKNILYSYGVIRPISVIPTGIYIDKFRKSNYDPEETKQLKEELGLKADEKIILSLGRVAKEKSIDVVINAIPALITKVPNARLVIVGDGPARTKLEEQVETLGISDKVLFAGAKPWDEIGKYYQLGDVFVSASVTETQGLTFAEAMAGGVPVVARNDQSVDGIVNDGVTGLLFDKPEDLSDKLFDILSHPQKQKELSDASLALIEELSADKFGANIESLYKDIIASPEKYDYSVHHTSLNPVHLGKRAAKAIRIHRMNSGFGPNAFKKNNMFSWISLAPKRAFRKISKKLK